MSLLANLIFAGSFVTSLLVLAWVVLRGPKK